MVRHARAAQGMGRPGAAARLGLRRGRHGPGLSKRYWLVVTVSSDEHAYQEGAAHGRPFDDYLPPFRQTAALCGMAWEAPLVLFGAHKVDNATVDAHIDAFRRQLTAWARPDLQPERD
ncbi:NAD(P)H-dependent oxidoreductase [Massilia sp. B-10]|nr:NAD(P)H-dependent oxidoreductase [Massilia sp. B-10]